MGDCCLLGKEGFTWLSLGGAVICPQFEIHKAVHYLVHKVAVLIVFPEGAGSLKAGTCSGAEVPKDPSGRVALNCFMGLVLLMGVPHD